MVQYPWYGQWVNYTNDMPVVPARYTLYRTPGTIFVREWQVNNCMTSLTRSKLYRTDEFGYFLDTD